MSEIKGLKDIKPLVEIPDISLWQFIAIVFVGLLLISALIYLLKKPKRRKRYRATPRELAKERLKNLDFSNTKDSIYSFCKDVEFLANDEKKDQIRDFLKSLDIYKYKKDVPTISSEDERVMREIIKEVCDG